MRQNRVKRKRAVTLKRTMRKSEKYGFTQTRTGSLDSIFTLGIDCKAFKLETS